MEELGPLNLKVAVGAGDLVDLLQALAKLLGVGFLGHLARDWLGVEDKVDWKTREPTVQHDEWLYT